ncbi:MAG: PHP domain-containing protein [Capsulimonadaceae bacterium]
MGDSVSLTPPKSRSGPALPDPALTRGGIDLHAHTTSSDGSDSPTELIGLAAQLGLRAIAVTDHDTTGGLAEARTAAEIHGIDFVPGVELSVEDEGGRFHLLGYLFDPSDALLATRLAEIRASRARRNVLMAERMAELGLPVTMDDVRAQAGDKGEVIARPHFARALLKAGVVTSTQDAFDRYLASGKPLYLPKDVLTPRDAISLLHSAGGLAVMAHPGLIPASDEALASRVAQLAGESSLDGIEAYYSQHTPAQTQRFLDIAARNSLIVTGGSDYHGTAKPHVPLGIISGGRSATPELLDALRARREKGIAGRS